MGRTEHLGTLRVAAETEPGAALDGVTVLAGRQLWQQQPRLLPGGPLNTRAAQGSPVPWGARLSPKKPPL